MRVEGAGFGVQGAGFRIQGLGFRVQGAGFRVQGSGFRVQGSGFSPYSMTMEFTLFNFYDIFNYYGITALPWARKVRMLRRAPRVREKRPPPEFSGKALGWGFGFRV